MYTVKTIFVNKQATITLEGKRLPITLNTTKAIIHIQGIIYKLISQQTRLRSLRWYQTSIQTEIMS